MCLSQDLTPIRELFPVCKKLIYLNHAGTGPLSIPGRTAIEECVAMYQKAGEFPLDKYFERVAAARECVARFINANSSEITFTHNTSEGLYIALVNLPLKPGDKVLVMEEVFPAARYVIDDNLPDVLKIYISFCGKDPVAAVAPYIDEKVRAVVVDHVQYLSGEMIELQELARYLHDRNIFLVVDGIQAIGATYFDVAGESIDFLACGAAKWLFGPSGTGFLYTNKRNFPLIRHIRTGWLGAQWTSFEDCKNMPPLYPDARMFEQGTRNIIGISAMHAQMKMLMGFGLDHVADHIQVLKKQLREGLLSAGYTMVTPDKLPQSGILTVQPVQESCLVFDKLKHNDIVVSLRSGYLRFSPHFYNSREEIEKVLEILSPKSRAV